MGHRVDYDGWGLASWSAAELEPVFTRVVERMRVSAYDRSDVVPFHEQCLEVAEAMGWAIASDLCDLDANDSFGLETVNVVDGTRWNAGFAYLDPIRDRPNLRIIDHVLADKVVDSASCAVVIAKQAGKALKIEAATVVLSAGVYGTPAILQRRGGGERFSSGGTDPRQVDLESVFRRTL